jgi:hypothetical protein
MNKRIKSLIERAEYQAKKQSGYEDWEVYVPPDPQVVFEKFAELIVEECAEVINRDITYQVDGGVVSNVFGLNQARDLIKEQFGVEE